MGNDREAILLLIYYSRQEDLDHRLLRHVIPYIGHYLPFDVYLSEPLRRIFPKVIIYDFLQQRADLGLKAMNDDVLALVRREHPKYVLWTSFNDDIRQTTLETIRKEGTAVVGWFFDDEIRFHSYSKYWIPYLDYCVTNAMSAVAEYRRLGARVIQTIPNTGIAVDVDWSRVEEKYDLAFVGSMRTADRRLYLNEFKINNIPVAVLGEGDGGYVSFPQMLDIFRTSRINLNFSKTVTYPWSRQIKGRVFQVCLAGGFLLTEQTPGIEKYFAPDKEIVCFDNPREMVDKARYYLEHAAERRVIARAGWERAHREYSSDRMVARVFDEIGKDLTSEVRDGDRATRLKLSLPARGELARYNLLWARAQIEENHASGFWKDDLAAAFTYIPWSLLPWFNGVIASLPSSARHSVFITLRRLEKRRFGITPEQWLTLKAFVGQRILRKPH
jgi:spore maturation protein CgeB